MFTVLSLNLSKKRTHVEAFGDDMPSPKMRKLMQGAHESKESKIEEGNRISEAIVPTFFYKFAILLLAYKTMTQKELGTSFDLND